MDSPALYAVVAVVVVIVAVVAARSGLLGKSKLPSLPDSGPLPVGELSKYYDREDPLAWERVRGWDLNYTPPALTAPAAYDHLVLTPRLLDFCSGKTGKLELVFNFLVGAIQRVDFDPAALPPGTGVAGQGLMTIHTPSGRTLVVATAAFAQTLQRAMARSGQVLAH